MNKIVLIAILAACSGCAVMRVEGKRADGAEWHMWHASLLWVRAAKSVDLANGTMGEYASQSDGKAAGDVVGGAAKVLVTP